jgi:hypothetical protein
MVRGHKKMLNPIIGEGISEATAEGTGYESKGYELLDETKIECIGCGKPAISLIVVKVDKYLPDCSFQLKCETCGQLSFKKKYAMRKVYFSPIKPFTILDLDTSLEAGQKYMEHNSKNTFTLFKVKQNE